MGAPQVVTILFRLLLPAERQVVVDGLVEGLLEFVYVGMREVDHVVYAEDRAGYRSLKSETPGAGSRAQSSTRLLEEHWRNILQVEMLKDSNWLQRSDAGVIHAPIRSISTRVPRSEQPGEPMSREGWSWK
jgi:hypothetical protein